MRITRSRSPRERRGAGARWSGAVAVVVVLLVAGASLWLRAGVPVVASPLRYDDGLFVRLAASLGSGDWLGRFDELTLVKVPGYPLFVAAVHGLGIPLKVGEQAIQLAAAAVLAGSLWLLTRRTWLSAAGFAVVALDPAAFSLVAAEVRRDYWYGSLSLLFLGLTYLTVRLASRRRPGAVAVAVFLTVPTGLVGAGYYLGREEWVWLLPALAVVVVLSAADRVRQAWWVGPIERRAMSVRGTRGGRHRPSTRNRRVAGLGVALRVLLVLGLASATGTAAVGQVAEQNRRHYGVAAIEDNSSGAYARAYALWASVEAGDPKPFVPITAAQRAAVYRVSPLADQLRPRLENPRNLWLLVSQRSCPDHGVCGDYASWLEGFAIRDAAAEVGHFGSESEVQEYFGGVAEEIRVACEDGRLRCRTGIIGLPGVRRVDPAAVVRTGLDGLWFAARSTSLTAPVPSVEELSEGHRPTADSQRMVSRVVVGQTPSPVRARAGIDHFATHQGMYRGLSQVYSVLLPVLGVLALIGTIGGLLLPGRAVPGLTGLCLALATAVLSRVALLGVLDVTTLPGAARTSTYEMATHVMLLGFAVAGTAQLAQLLRRRAADAGRPEPPEPPGPAAQPWTVPVQDLRSVVDLGSDQVPVRASAAGR